MKSLKNQLTEIMSTAFAASGFDMSFGEVTISTRPELGDFQCNGAMAVAQQTKTNPRQIADQLVRQLSQSEIFEKITIDGPGFINLTVTREFLLEHTRQLLDDEYLGCRLEDTPQKILIDYGGPNVAKPLHVGHLRSAIIGESIKRIARYVGHDVVGDVHLGDWGLQMGMIICELRERQPDLPYFDDTHSGSYPVESPVTTEDLEEIYTTASKKSKADDSFMEAARKATSDLQQGKLGYYALWKHIVNVSLASLKEDYENLDVHFDLWLGESDVQQLIPDMVEKMVSSGIAHESGGALIVDGIVYNDHDLPPLILLKSDKAALYSTTDLATIYQRVQEHNVDAIWYVVDNRQSNHFLQVFDVAYRSNLLPSSVRLEHLGFGTMNGPDGKPFKTREGGVLKLKDLMTLVISEAKQQIENVKTGEDYSKEEKENIALKVGIATIKFADLQNYRVRDYVFDVNRFAEFEGKTGPYMLYTVTRIKSILRKAREQHMHIGPLMLTDIPIERNLLLKVLEFPNILSFSFETRAPHHLCHYLYELASLFSSFYHDFHILNEQLQDIQASRLELLQIIITVLEQGLYLLGIETLDYM